MAKEKKVDNPAAEEARVLEKERAENEAEIASAEKKEAGIKEADPKKAKEVKAEKLEKVKVVRPCVVNGVQADEGDEVQISADQKEKLGKAGCLGAKAKNRMMTT